MINMAVISLKDIIKYLVKTTLVIAVVVGLIQYFSHAKENANKTGFLAQNTLLSCVDITVPGIASLNHTTEEKKQTANIEPLKVALGIELEMLTSVTDGNTQAVANTDQASNEQKTDQEEKENQKKQQNQDQQEKVQHAETGLETQVQKSNVPEKYTTQYNGVKIRNETEYKLTKEILTPDITVNKKNILLFHTHSCESYTPSEKYQYKQTGNFRTTDKNYSVIRVGTELTNQLQSYGYNVIHDTGYHDYPSYSGSYSSSLKTVTKLLEENENTDVVIDLHRDAIGDNTYAPTVKIGDEYAAQLMFVIGGNGSSIKHENWQQNLKFAVKVQEKANELYPGLFKPIILRYSGYNQHVAKAASIIEVGATGNTLDQTLVSMKYLAKVLSEVLK